MFEERGKGMKLFLGEKERAHTQMMYGCWADVRVTVKNSETSMVCFYFSNPINYTGKA